MMIETGTGGRRIFVPAILPWLLGAAMFALYGLTLYHTATSESMNRLAEISGWDWRPQLFAPVTYLATYPLHWLPAGLHLAGLNLFSAACAALTLVLLARSVALLPHDRTNEQRIRETSEFALISGPMAWLAPLFAVLICGLQMTFWERAVQFVDTSMFDNGEILNLLLFVYVVRCLLEFRIQERQSWMSRAALAFGLAMANNWGMIGFLPLFLAALIWIKGLEFFEWRFVLRMFLWGLLGLSSMFLLPLLIQFRHLNGFGFGPALHFMLANDKGALQIILGTRKLFPILAVTSVLPITLIGVRWATSFGDNSPLGVAFASVTMTLAHGFFLACCLWVALDPTFGPRQMISSVPALPIFYLGALSVGYFTGYFLIVLGRTPVRQRQKSPWLNRAASTAALVVVLCALAGAAGLLAVTNSGRIAAGRAAADATSRYFARIAEALPAGPAVVVSDDPGLLFHLQAAETGPKAGRRDLLIDTSALARSWDYVNFQERTHPEENIGLAFTNRKAPVPPDIDCIHLLEQLFARHDIYYVQPSYGYYFERFYAEPHGLTYRLKEYSTNSWAPPALDSAVYAENAAFWNGLTNELSQLAASLSREPAPSTNSWQQFERARLFAPEPDRAPAELSQLYSRALNYWGVAAQRSASNREADKLDHAFSCFELAKELNSGNGPAMVNAAFNRQYRDRMAAATNALLSDDQLPGLYRNWYDEINVGGPFDEPHYCARYGLELRNGGNFRQAIVAFRRMQELMPGSATPSILLSQTYAMVSGANSSLAYAYPSAKAACYDAVAAADEALRIAPDETNALYLKSLGSLRLGAALQLDTNGTERPYPSLEEAYRAGLDAVDRLMATGGREPAAVYLKANSLMSLKRFDEAIPLWSELMALQTNTAQLRFGRALAYYQTGRYGPAKQDYEQLLKDDPHLYPAYYALGQMADTNGLAAEAVTNFELYLSNVPTAGRQSSEYLGIERRVKELKAAAK